MGTDYVKFFFIVWYIIAVVVTLNIIIAFVIDHLSTNFKEDDYDDLF
jgi:hypothetical protein